MAAWKKGRNGINKNLTLAGSRTQVSAILGPRVNRYATGASGMT